MKMIFFLEIDHKRGHEEFHVIMKTFTYMILYFVFYS